MAQEQEIKPIVGGAPTDAAHDRAAEMVGRTIAGKYKIEELVAMGGIASVFRATKLDGGQDVAIKTLQPNSEGLPEMIERFEREAIAGKHIYHPNVAAAYEFDQIEDGTYYLVLEFVRGKTLRDLIDEGPIEPARAARVGQKLAEALCAAHDIGIVHRDLKPRNVMIVEGEGGADQVKLIDFGLAKVPVEHLTLIDGDGRRSLTQAGVVLGTVAYMAPEAMLGMKSIDRRSDLYALGVILYEMLAGKHPFTAKDPAALFTQHRTAIPQRIEERSPGVRVPPAIEEVVRKLLEKDPEARYPHARAVIVALETALQKPEQRSLPSTGVESLREVLPGKVARPRVLALGAGLALLAVLAVVLTLAMR